MYFRYQCSCVFDNFGVIQQISIRSTKWHQKCSKRKRIYTYDTLKFFMSCYSPSGSWWNSIVCQSQNGILILMSISVFSHIWHWYSFFWISYDWTKISTLHNAFHRYKYVSIYDSLVRYLVFISSTLFINSDFDMPILMPHRKHSNPWISRF